MLDISRQHVSRFTLSSIASPNDGTEIKVMARVKTIYHLVELIEVTFSWKIVNLFHWKVQALLQCQHPFHAANAMIAMPKNWPCNTSCDSQNFATQDAVRNCHRNGNNTWTLLATNFWKIWPGSIFPVLKLVASRFTVSANQYSLLTWSDHRKRLVTRTNSQCNTLLQTWQRAKIIIKRVIRNIVLC